MPVTSIPSRHKENTSVRKEEENIYVKKGGKQFNGPWFKMKKFKKVNRQYHFSASYFQFKPKFGFDLDCQTHINNTKKALSY